MALRRFNRAIRPLSQKGKPGSICRRITVRINADGKKQQFHPTKGWRRMI